jgi:hypothetical protein
MYCGRRTCRQHVLTKRQQARHLLDESGRRLPATQPRPLYFVELVGNPSVALMGAVNDDRQQKCLLGSHQVGTIHREFPFEPEISLDASARICGNDRDEQDAGLDPFPDCGVPSGAATKFVLIEPHCNTCIAQAGADPRRGLCVLRSVADEDGSMPVRGGNRVASRPRFVGHGVLRGGSFLKPQNEPRRLIAQTGSRARGGNRSQSRFERGRRALGGRSERWVFPLSPSQLPSVSCGSPESVHERSSQERGPHHHEIETAGMPRGQGGRPGWWCGDELA